MKYAWSCLLVFCANVLAAYLLFFLVPASHDALLQEDGAVENLSAVLYLYAFLAGMFLFRKSVSFRKSLLLVGVLGLVGCLDEISFGERLTGAEMPELLGFKVDGVHDLFYVAAITLDSIPRLYAALLVLAVMGVLAFVAVKYAPRLIRALWSLYPRSSIIIGLVFMTQLFISLVIDLELIRHDLLFVLEEQLEMNAAVSLICLSLSLYGVGLAQAAPVAIEE